jgi:hypothetical protein
LLAKAHSAIFFEKKESFGKSTKCKIFEEKTSFGKSAKPDFEDQGAG